MMLGLMAAGYVKRPVQAGRKPPHNGRPNISLGERQIKSSQSNFTLAEQQTHTTREREVAAPKLAIASHLERPDWTHTHINNNNNYYNKWPHWIMIFAH